MNLRTHEIGSKIFKWAVTVLVLVAVSGVSSCKQANGNNTKKPNTPVVPVVVRFDDSTIEVYKAGGSQIHPGDILLEGTQIGFELLKPPAGQQVDKWAINSKRLPDNGYMIVAADAVDDAGQKVIEITYTLKPAEGIVVRFDESTIKVVIEGNGAIHNGDTVYEGRRIFLTLKNPPAGQQIDKWKVNAKELNHRNYTVNAANAVEDAGKKTIVITYTLKPL